MLNDPEGTHQEELARSTRESAIYLASKAVPFLCNLLFIKFYTLSFTPEVVGNYETILALGMILSSFAVGWLQISLLRFYPKYRNENRLAELALGVLAGWVVSIILVVVLGGLSWLFRGTRFGEVLALNLLPGVVLIVLSNSLFVLTTTFLRAKRLPGRFSLATASYSFFNLSFGYLLFLFAGSFLVSLVAGTALALLVPSLAILAASSKHLDSFRRAGKGTSGERPAPSLWSVLAPLFAFGLPLSLNQAASQLLNVSDRYLILVLLGDQQAGVYSVVYRIGDFAVRFVILSLMMSAYTAVTETFEKKGRESAEGLVASLTRLYLILAVPLVVGCWGLGREIVQVLAGSEYVQGASILGWILLGNLFLGLSQYQNFGLHLSKRTLVLAGLTFSAALLNLILNLFLLPAHGYPAAAYTTCFCFGLLALVTPRLARRYLTWSIPLKSVFRITVAAAGMAIPLFLWDASQLSDLGTLLVKGGVGTAVYLVSLWGLGEIQPKRGWPWV